MKRWHLLLIFIILIGGWLALWPLGGRREISMLVVDKTVPEEDYREHRAIFWIAKHRRFTRPDGNFYSFERDYLGYHPLDERREQLRAVDLDDIDLLYLADAYGIYDYEEGLVVYEEQLPYEHQDIRLLYGGFNSSEVAVVENFAKREGAIIVGEHNIFGFPTSEQAHTARRLQKVFGVEYTGWLTRHYSNLDEAAFWLKELYSELYGLPWDLSGPGLVFVREENADFGWLRDLVIVQGDNMKGPWPVLTNTEHFLTGGAAEGVPYLYWVEVLEVGPQAETLAYLELPLAEEAYASLQQRGLPERLPALIYLDPPDKAERIYFAGDFADQLPALLPASLTGSAKKQRFFSYLPGLPVEYRFYFQWYEPVLTNIFEGITNE